MMKMKINKIIFICVLSIALGVLYIFTYDVLEPFLQPFGLKYLISGFWLMGAMFFSFIILKPDSALKKMKINKIIFICVLSIALGVLFTIIYDILEPFLKTLGSKYLISGFWLMGAMVFGYIIRKPGSALKKMKINEIIFICVLSIAMGVFWWGYTFIYDILEPFLQPFGLKYLISGFWLMGAMFFGYIIRKPGSALLGELIPAFIQAFVARWGLTSILWGVVQGLPVELFFLALHYKKLSAGKMAIAGSLAAFASYFFDFFIKKYYYYTWQFNLIQLTGFVISGAVLGGFLAKLTADQLQATGVLNQFEITRDGK